MVSNYADDKTRVVCRPGSETLPECQPGSISVRQPDFWLEAEGIPGGKIKFPEGAPVTVGRNEDQDLSITDRTMSRNHLVLTRRGSKIAIEIKGLNGLTLNDVSYKNQVIDVVAPISFLLGVLPFRIYQEEEIDEDATIMVNTAPDEQSQPAFPPPRFTGPGLESPQPSIPPPHDQFQQGPDLGRAQQTGPEFPTSSNHSYPPMEPELRQMSPAGAYPENRPSSVPATTPLPDTSVDFKFRKSRPQGSTKPKKKILTAGICLLVLLILGAGGYWGWKKFTASHKTMTTGKAQSRPGIQSTARENAAEENSYGNDYYGKLIRDARNALESGDKEKACKYLKGIPKGDINYKNAFELARRIEGCQLAE